MQKKNPGYVIRVYASHMGKYSPGHSGTCVHPPFSNENCRVSSVNSTSAKCKDVHIFKTISVTRRAYLKPEHHPYGKDSVSRRPSIRQDVCSTWCRPACKCCLQAQTILTIPRNLADTVLKGSCLSACVCVCARVCVRVWVCALGESGHYMHIKCSAPSTASVLRQPCLCFCPRHSRCSLATLTTVSLVGALIRCRRGCGCGCAQGWRWVCPSCPVGNAVRPCPGIVPKVCCKVFSIIAKSSVEGRIFMFI